jgi:glycosyltransferase involved in cell wall biosynthesis
MATGVPVAATNVGGVSELLDGGRCGLILGEDPKQWPDRIEALLDAQWLREDFARLGRRRVENRYSAQPWMRRIMAIYDRLLHIPPAVQPLRRAA